MMQTLLTDISKVIARHLPELVFGITSVILVLCGPHINRIFRKVTSKIHIILRFILYVILCCAGYGFITHYIYTALISFFRNLDNTALTISMLLSYLLLAFLAKRKKEI